MSILKANVLTTHTYKFTADVIADLIRKDLGLDTSAEVTFKVLHKSDQYDRGPGVPYLHSVEVVTKTC